MTDKEIIKALECCKKPVGSGACNDCPLDKNRPCTTMMMESALDLINRQQAEIERLQTENNQFADIGKMYSEIKAEAIKEFAERLKKRGFADKHYEHESIVYVADIDNLAKEMVGDN